MKKIATLILIAFSTLLFNVSNAQNNCLHFNGNSYVQFNNATWFNFNSASTFTIEAWVKTNQMGNQTIFTKINSFAAYSGYELFIRNGAVGMYLISNFGNSDYIELATVSNTFANNQWHHLAATYNGNSNASGVKIYVDGVLQTANVIHNSLTGSISSASNVRMGIRDDGNQAFPVYIDEVRVWNSARTAAEIQSHMNCSITALEDNLVANYNFNQGIAGGSNPNDTILNDNGGNSLNATLHNFLLTGATANWEDATANGVNSNCALPAGQSLRLDGIDDYVNMYNPTEFNFQNTDKFTFESWIKTGAGGQQSILSHLGFQFGPQGYELDIVNGKIALYLISVYPSNYIYIETQNTFNDNQWHQVAITYSGNSNANGVVIYVDGVAQATTVYSNTLAGSIQNNRPLIMGSRYATQYFFNGSIDELRIWNLVRTPNEIQDHADCHLTGSECGLLVYYNFNQGTPTQNNAGETTLLDSSLNGFNAGLNNFTLDGTVSNWVYGSPASNTACALPIYSNIELHGNGIKIKNNDVTPSSVDYTVIGYAQVNTTITKTLYIKNPGTVPLLLTGTPYVQLTGAAPFIITQPASGSINPNDSIAFGITYQPLVLAGDADTVSISTNSCIGTFKFNIAGTSAPCKALNFDGVDDNVLIGNPSSLNFTNTSQFTIETWFKTGSANQQIIVSKLNKLTPFTGYELFINQGKIELYLINTFSSNYIDVATQNIFNDNQFHHLAVCYNGNSDASGVAFYVDGVLQVKNVIANNLTASCASANNLLIGSRNGIRFTFNGTLDEVRFWSYARSQAQIQSNMNCELTGLECGLLACYNFNQGFAGIPNTSETNVPDLTNYHLNATAINFSLNGLTSNFVTSGGNLSGTCNSSGSLMNVYGNNIAILNNSFSTKTTDNTAFGFVPLNTSSSKTFYIKNQGTLPLVLTGTPFVQLSGNTQFSVTSQPALSNINAGDSVAFTVAYSPLVSLEERDTIIINSNSSYSCSPYSFVVDNLAPAKALHFDGVNDYVLLDSSAQFAIERTTAFTIESWIKTSAANQRVIFSKMQNAAPFRGYELFMLNGKITFYLISTFGSDYIQVQTVNTFNNSQWHHIAVTYNGNSNASGINIYADGILQPLVVLGNSLTASTVSTANALIGNRNGLAYPFSGYIDDIRFWNHERTQTEIINSYSCELTSSECGLIAYYKFNQAIGNSDNPTDTILFDASPNAINGKLKNFALTGATSNWINPGATINGTCSLVIPTWYYDGDGDGYYGNMQVSCNSPGTGWVTSGIIAGDCNDSNPALYQTLSGYVDADGDGYTVGGLISVCSGATLPAGYSATSLGTDCDDANNLVYQNGSFYIDLDFDGYNNGSTTLCYGAVIPLGYTLTTLGPDCNDNDAAVHQTLLGYVDADGDGYTVGGLIPVCSGATLPAGYSATSLGTDCNDTDANIYPGATEIPGNGIDENCNGMADDCIIAIGGSTNDVSCKGSATGSIITVVINATTPIHYLWSNGSTTANQSNLFSGIYTVTVTDAVGCSTTMSATIMQPANSLIISATKTNVRCGNKATGSATALPSGGETPYFYSWSNGLGSVATVNNLSAGTFTVTVTDILGCSKTKTISITQNPSLVVIVNTTGNSATATVSGGVTAYSYLWNTTPSQTNATATGLLLNHTYKVKVTDSKNCTKLVTVQMPATRLSDNQIKIGVSIYPNPTTGMITLNGFNCQNCNCKLDLYDLLGNVVYSKSLNVETVISLDLSNLSKGVYMLQVIYNNTSQITKLIIE